MDNKGQGLSLNTIIVAIIVLVVLVVLIMVFTGVLGNFTGEVSSCASNGGVCETTAVCNEGGSSGRRELTSYTPSCNKGNEDGKVCCSISFWKAPPPNCDIKCGDNCCNSNQICDSLLMICKP